MIMIKNSSAKVFLLGLILFILLSSNDCSNDDTVVTGKVYPAGMTVPMRDVMVKIISIDTFEILTDGNGYFKINVPQFPVELEFSKATYQTQIVKVKKPSDIVVYMNVGI